jgi:hypothetical protein
MLDLCFARGLLTGTHWAMTLLRPLSISSRPRNPYWCPLRWFIWRMAFMIGAHQVLSAKSSLSSLSD